MSQRRRIAVYVLSALTAGALLAVGLVWQHSRQPKHLLTVADGILYRSGLLRSENLEKVLDEYGIRTVVSLVNHDSDRAARVVEESRTCRERGIRFVDMPMNANSPPTPEQVAQWLALLDDEENWPILVHCRHGVVRTGMMVAVYEMEYEGKGNQQVLRELPRFGHDFDTPRSKPVRDFILDYTPRAKRAHPES